MHISDCIAISGVCVCVYYVCNVCGNSRLWEGIQAHVCDITPCLSVCRQGLTDPEGHCSVLASLADWICLSPLVSIPQYWVYMRVQPCLAFSF